jgi:membrane dipeptidase
MEAVAGKGGVVCAGFVPSFLEPDARVSSLDKLLDQMDYMVQVAGEDHIGLGSDFDGMGESRVVGLEDASKMPAITAGLLERGYSEEAIRKLLGGNLLRVFREVVG